MAVWLQRFTCAALLAFGAGCSTPAYDDSDAGDTGPAKTAEVVQDAAPMPREVDAGFDADTPDTGSRACVDCKDASVAPPAWADSLLGQYAMRARFFGRGGLVGVLNPLTTEWIMLATVAFDEARAEVVMTAQLCVADGENNVAGFVGNVAPLYPQRLPPREFTVRSDGNEWWTVGDPMPYGYSAQSLNSSCENMPGAIVPRAPEQIWNADGLCTCPQNPSKLPDSVRDCRINDADHDGAPGATVSVTGALDMKFHVRMLDSSQIVHGKFDRTNRKHSGGYATSADLMQLGCNPEPCAQDFAMECDASLNPVVLMPLDAPAEGVTRTCDDVLDNRDKLFGTDPLVFPPSGC